MSASPPPVDPREPDEEPEPEPEPESEAVAVEGSTDPVTEDSAAGVPASAGENSVAPATGKLRPSDMPKRERPKQPFELVPRRKSHRDHQAEVKEYAKLARELADLAPHKLPRVELREDSLAALERCRGLKRGPLNRELRRFATILRREDMQLIKTRLAEVSAGDRHAVVREKSYEAWRERLINEGDEAFSALVTRYPAVDRQQMRQLIRTARKDPTAGRTKAAFRSILREVRILDQAAPSSDAGDVSETETETDAE